MSRESPANQYLATKVLSASPEQLRLMLIDGAIKFTRQGRDALARKDYEGCFNGYSRAREIILELVTSMRPEVEPELCQRLSGIYMFMYGQLVESSANKEPALADKVLELLEYDRQTWVMLMDKLHQEKTAAGAVRAAVDAGAATPAMNSGTPNAVASSTPGVTSSFSFSG